jgi:hypothetical protein
VAFQPCTTTQAPFFSSNPVTVLAGRLTSLNYTMSQF